MNERKGVESVLNRSKSQGSRSENGSGLFSMLFQNSPVGIYIVQDGRFQYVNPEFQLITGYSEDDLSGMGSMSLVFPEDRALVRESALKMLRGGRTAPYEHSFVTKDGKTKHALQRLASIDYRGRRATLGCFMDITERERAIQSLRISEQKLYKAFHASPNWVEISALEDGFLVDVNQAFLRLSGYRREEVIGRTSTELRIWVDPKKRSEMVELLSEEGSIHDLEVDFRMKTGDVRSMLLSAELIDYGGEQCLIASAHDITARKRGEEQRLERAKQKGTVTLVTQLGLTMVGSILLCFAIGYYLDKWLHTRGLFITIFTVLGVIGGGYNAYRQIMETTGLDKENKSSSR